MNAVRIRTLVKSFEGRAIFDGFDLTLRRGEILAVLGASGSGKSTLLRCIAKLTALNNGTIATAGEIAYIFQEPRLFPWSTVRKNVAFAARNPRERERGEALIDRVGLRPAADRLPKHLSAGMAQRAALARALVREPHVVLFDEPLAALDALLRIDLGVELRRLIKENSAAAIFVTHDVDEALRVADRAIVIGGVPACMKAEVPLGENRRTIRLQLLNALGVTEEVDNDNHDDQVDANLRPIATRPA